MRPTHPASRRRCPLGRLRRRRQRLPGPLLLLLLLLVLRRHSPAVPAEPHGTAQGRKKQAGEHVEAQG